MKIVMPIFTLLTCFISTLSLGAERSQDETVQIDSVLNYLADQDANRSAFELRIAPVRSQAQLKAYLRDNRRTPLDALSTGGRSHFLSSLDFNEKGLTTFNYADLQKELTPTQIYQVLALFGKQHDTALITNARPEHVTDAASGAVPMCGGMNCVLQVHDNYYCDKNNPHTCNSAANQICTSNC
jgi:hypothetical protein